jgi:hypothetical protein
MLNPAILSARVAILSMVLALPAACGHDTDASAPGTDTTSTSSEVPSTDNETVTTSPLATLDDAGNPFPYSVETFIKENFLEEATQSGASVLTDTSLVYFEPGDSHGLYQDSPIVAIVELTGADSAEVDFRFDTFEPDGNQTIVFITVRPDGIVDVMQSRYVTDVRVGESAGLIEARFQQNPDGSLSFGTPSGTQPSGSVLFESDVANGIGQRLAADGRDTPTTLSALLGVQLD